MANGNGRKGWLTLPVAITIGTLAVTGLWRTFQLRGDIDKAVEALARINVDGTEKCRQRELHDATMDTEVQHMRSDLTEVKSDVKEVQSALTQQNILLEQIKSQLEKRPD